MSSDNCQETRGGGDSGGVGDGGGGLVVEVIGVVVVVFPLRFIFITLVNANEGSVLIEKVREKIQTFITQDNADLKGEKAFIP